MVLKDREKLIIGIGIGIVFLIMAYTLLFEPLHKDKLALRRERIHKEELINKYTTLLSQNDSTQREIKSLMEKEKILKKTLFRGDSPALAAAEIQSLLHRLSSGLSLSIVSEKVSNPKKIDSFSVIPVEIVLKGSMKNMMQFIFRIENADKYMRIKEMKLRVTKRVRADEGETIESRIEAEGFILERDNLS